MRASSSLHGLLPEPGSAGAAAAARLLAATTATDAAYPVSVSAGATVPADLPVTAVPAAGGTACSRVPELLPTGSAGNGAARATGAATATARGPAASPGRRPCGSINGRGYGPRGD